MTRPPDPLEPWRADIKAALTDRDSWGNEYKRAFWKLALKLKRLPTTHDPEYWALTGDHR